MKKIPLLFAALFLLLTACRAAPYPAEPLALAISPDGYAQSITAVCTCSGGAAFSCTEDEAQLTLTMRAEELAACTLTFSGGVLTLQAERTGKVTRLSHTLICNGDTTQQQACAFLPGGSAALSVTIPAVFLRHATLVLSFDGQTCTYTYPQ